MTNSPEPLTSNAQPTAATTDLSSTEPTTHNNYPQCQFFYPNSTAATSCYSFHPGTEYDVSSSCQTTANTGYLANLVDEDEAMTLMFEYMYDASDDDVGPANTPYKIGLEQVPDNTQLYQWTTTGTVVDYGIFDDCPYFEARVGIYFRQFDCNVEDSFWFICEYDVI